MKQYTKLLYLLALLRLIIPYFLQDSIYQPHRDEFLYLSEGSHMAWGYMEVPPMLSVFAWLTNFFGGSMFWIKFWPSLFGSLTFLLVGRIILSLGGRAFALVLGWLPFLIDGYVRVFFLFQPNCIEIFFWTLIGFSLVRYIQTSQNKWLYLFGVAVGLGLLSKYTVAFYTACILVSLLITRHRRIFLNKHLYYAGAIAFLIFLPNLLWQYNHRFPVFFHMHELQEYQLQYVSPVSFIAGQIFMNLPMIFVWVAGLFFLVFAERGKPYRAFGWAYILIIIFLLVMHGKDYYALGAYPILFAFGAYHLEAVTTGRLKWARYAMLIFGLILGAYAMPVALPVAKPETLHKYYEKSGVANTGALTWEDQQKHPLPQDFADMMGWKEIALKTADVFYGLHDSIRIHTLIYCRSYGVAGAINYYGKQYRLPEVYSGNATFLLWMPDTYKVKAIILVGHDLPDSTETAYKQFATYSVVDSLNMPLARENGIKFTVFRNPTDSVNEVIERIVAEHKKRFIR
ncbi:glycosyltransferase family 39 protein [Pinibacter aurantiacus]|uniref:Glycosyltransferase family 39 protein n=1 Tax=Pinibacter aurantiacus TaxID=2851599 RepID=A0A9E2W5Q4_9BACT|nr:glycosyltransferase family 39 protein [Pinibacter aurantiacus]MBV4359134.1 glycosyltransferase family 39 protein [Pinibacter aurantiacus]